MLNKVTFLSFKGAIAPIAPQWIRPWLVIHFRDKFLAYLKMTFYHNAKKNLFHMSTNIPTFFQYIGWPEGPEIPAVIASAISSILFFNDTSWRSYATTLLVKLGLFLSLRRPNSVTTCFRFSVPLQVSQKCLRWTSLSLQNSHFIFLDFGA